MRVLLGQDDASFTQALFQTGCGSGPCIPYILASLYSIMGLVTLIQLARIHFLVHISQWTMQKGFQTLNVVICLFRAVSLFACEPMHRQPETAGIATFVVDFTSLLFFSTYTLLVLFWAEIVHVEMDVQWQCSLQTIFVVINVAGYVTGALLWSLCAYDETLHVGRRASALLLATLDIVAMAAFAYYGGKLLTLLKHSPIRSATLMNKVTLLTLFHTAPMSVLSLQIREVSSITAISVISFILKAATEIASTLKEKGLTYSEDGVLDMMFYAFAEIITMGGSLCLSHHEPWVVDHRECSGVAESYSRKWFCSTVSLCSIFSRI